MYSLCEAQPTVPAHWYSLSPCHMLCRGQFPSLGFCSCHKKDGLPCSMPCDTEKTGGRLVPRRLGTCGDWALPNKGPYRLDEAMGNNNTQLTSTYLLGWQGNHRSKNELEPVWVEACSFPSSAGPPPRITHLACEMSWVFLAGLFLPHNAPRSAEGSQLRRDEEIPGYSRCLRAEWCRKCNKDCPRRSFIHSSMGRCLQIVTHFASPKRKYHHPRRYHHNNYTAGTWWWIWKGDIPDASGGNGAILRQTMARMNSIMKWHTHTQIRIMTTARLNRDNPSEPTQFLALGWTPDPIQNIATWDFLRFPPEIPTANPCQELTSLRGWPLRWQGGAGDTGWRHHSNEWHHYAPIHLRT